MNAERNPAVGDTPLVELVRVGAGLPVPVLVKCEQRNPAGSVKDRIAVAIVDDAERRGALRPGATLVEATAGNTGLGLAWVARARGYRVVCVLPQKMSQDKRDALTAAGAQVIVTANAPPSSPENFRNVAARLAAEHGWYATDQFANPANIAAHETTTASELLRQTGGRIGAFVVGAGTGGTITGVARRLRAEGVHARIVLADPVGSGFADWIETGTLGPDAPYLVEGIGGSEPPVNLDRAVIDAAERVGDDESFAMARRLLEEEGLAVGGSSGTNVAAALRVAAAGVGKHGRPLVDPVITVIADGLENYRTCAWARGL